MDRLIACVAGYGLAICAMLVAGYAGWLVSNNVFPPISGVIGALVFAFIDSLKVPLGQVVVTAWENGQRKWSLFWLAVVALVLAVAVMGEQRVLTAANDQREADYAKEHRLIVRSEEDAFRILKGVLSGTIEVDERSELHFDGWPKFEVKTSVGHASFTPEFAKAFIALQDSLLRTYALVSKGDPNIAKLTDEQVRAVTVEVAVAPGSSAFTALTAQVGDALAQVIKEKMKPNHFVIVALAGMGFYFAGAAWRGYYTLRNEALRETQAHEERSKREEPLRQMTAAELEKTRLLDAAHREVKGLLLDRIKEQADEAKHSFLRHAPAEGTITLQGSTLTGKAAHQLARNLPHHCHVGKHRGHTQSRRLTPRLSNQCKYSPLPSFRIGARQLLKLHPPMCP